MSDPDSGFNRIDSELRQIEGLIDELVAACKMGLGFAKRMENNPGWSEEHDRKEIDYIRSVLERAEWLT